MNSGNIEYLNLRELSNEEYTIVDGEADITGWPVIDESQTPVGKVRDLLFDPEQNAIRYVIVDLDADLSITEDKAILIPIGLANLGEAKKEVVIPVLEEAQYNSMPRYIIGEVTRDTEMKIRSAIGSPAALRIEEEIVEMNLPDFYAHHHFDRGNVTLRKNETKSAESAPESMPENRREEHHVIHQLIDNSETGKSSGLIKDHPVPGKQDTFTVNTTHGVFTVALQENGTYRISEGENKIGVIYAEPGHDGTKWRTMDHLDAHFVISLGDAITAHNS
ncbi:PRC-barrel domain-containing protein [Pedobacter jamesrossensis]|uniref:PRC-barrel domain-containing protein n=1 Tax=Pedobacter jamesrossensis TaxID=1908238 RepID=A0ABV8NNU2_9SPHI